MGWALDKLSEAERRDIAGTLFEVTDETSSGWLNGKCPLHDDAKESFGYNYLQDCFKCMGACDLVGDLVKLFSLVHGLDDREGFAEFKRRYGSSVSDDSPRPKKTSKQGKPSGSTRSAAAGAPPAPPGPPSPQDPPADPPVTDHIPEDIWARLPKLPDTWVARLEKERGWTREAIDKLGLRLQTLGRRKDGSTFEIRKPERVAIPIRDGAGILRNIRLYKPWDRKPEDQKIISWGAGFGKGAMFPPAPLSQSGPVHYLEGEPDTICAISRGLNGITRTGKARVWLQDQTGVFRDRDVVVIPDEDKPGHDQAQHAARIMAPMARSVRILVWPAVMRGGEGEALPEKHGQDLTDFFVRHGRTNKDMEELFSRAVLVQKPDEESLRVPSEFFAIGESGRSSFKPSLLVRRIMEDISLLYDPKTGLLYQYDGKMWQIIPLEHVQRMAIHYLALEASKSRVNDVSEQVRILASLEQGREVNDQVDWICVENGMFNLKTMELLPHGKHYYSTYKLGVTWDPSRTNKPKRWLEYLKEAVQSPEAIGQLQEYFGLCLSRDTKFAKALLLFGPGSDGKSIALKILRALVGEENCASVSFKDLEDQFHRASLYNKLLNVATEIGGQALESPYFKAIVTGDAISASYKHMTPFQFSPFCKLAYSCNKLPRVLDNSDGYYRRLLLIEFPRQFEGEDDDKDLEVKLLEELDGIFEWAVLGYARLRERGYFLDSVAGRKLILSYKRLNNPVLCFVEDECELGRDYQVQKDDIWSSYKSYCNRNGYKQSNRENFFRELKAAIHSLRDIRPRVESGDRPRCLQGITLNVSPSSSEASS